MISRVILRAAVVSAALNFLLPSFGGAATGSLTQLSGAAGCVSDDGTGGACVDGSGLGGAGWVAVSPDGMNVYTASFNSFAVATFARDAKTGALTQLSGTAGCVSETGDGVTCADGIGLDGAVSVVVSPDGKNVYVASRGGNSVAAFSRNQSTGALTQLSGAGGCIDETGTTGCTVGKALGGPRSIAISPDGKNVYVGSRDANAVAAFSRDATTGVLTQLNGFAGCVSDDGTNGRCVDGTGLLGARGVTVSPDGQHVYVASEFNSSLAIFSRDPITGALTQLSGTAGCIAETGDGVTCADGRGLVNPIHVEVSPDGNHVYVASRDSASVVVFSRNVVTGALTQLSGPAGCISETGDGITCADGRGLNGAVYILVSPDGNHVYVASQVSNAVAVFSRNTTTGALTQLSGPAGCIAETGDGVTCADGIGLNGAIAVTVSPDGQNVYAASYISSAVTIFSRNTTDQAVVNLASMPNLTLAGGSETSGLARGPAFQLFNTAGVLQTTRFALNPDFRADVNILLGNFDIDAANEVLVGGRETSGLKRGPAYQIFDTDGTFRLTNFALNPDFINVTFAPFNVGSNGVLVCGLEATGLSRGPAYQAFDGLGNLVRTQFVLNADFTADNSCLVSNLDGVVGDEVIVGGREVTGLARGPAIQGFGSNGALLFTRLVLNADFTQNKFTMIDGVGTKAIVASGSETGGLKRGPAFQIWDSNGNFVLTRFVLNADFTAVQVFGANTTNAVTGQEIVTGGVESTGLARGPFYQVWDKNGNLLLTRLVLNSDFTDVTFTKIDINNDGVDEILVVGNETKGLRRGPTFQLFDGSGNLLVSQVVLNADFTNLTVFAVDQLGVKEIGIGGVESKGLSRGPAYQLFQSNGSLIQTVFVLNSDF